MNKERLEEIKDKWDYAYESEKDGSYLSIEDIEFLIEQAERVQELESFKNSVEYTVDTETIELIVENQDSDVALSSVETYDEEIFFLKKRVQELIKAHELKDLEHQGLVRQLKEKDKQNKRYRDLISGFLDSGYASDWAKDQFIQPLEGVSDA